MPVAGSRVSHALRNAIPSIALTSTERAGREQAPRGQRSISDRARSIYEKLSVLVRMFSRRTAPPHPTPPHPLVEPSPRASGPLLPRSRSARTRATLCQAVKIARIGYQCGVTTMQSRPGGLGGIGKRGASNRLASNLALMERPIPLPLSPRTTHRE